MTHIRRRSQLWLIIVVAILFFFTASRYANSSWFMLIMSPALDALHEPVQWWQSANAWFLERESLQRQFLDSQKQLQQQAALIQEAATLREENRQLRNILDIVGITGYHWHAAKVSGRSPENMSRQIIIQVYGASPDSVIVSSEGLVGLVDKVSASHATVRTIFDASITVPVTIPGTALAAVSRGLGDRLSIDFVPRDIAPRVGAVLYTSGAGGLFPAGIAVARIIDVQPVPGQLFARITAEPIAHWRRDNWLAVASQLRKPAP
jgi:rod shape-determining protein MreC